MNKDKALGIGILLALLLGISSLWQTTSLNSKVADLTKIASSTIAVASSTAALTVTNYQEVSTLANFLMYAFPSQVNNYVSVQAATGQAPVPGQVGATMPETATSSGQ